jgi:drug/metabolite transporter (DMT)-like permease
MAMANARRAMTSTEWGLLLFLGAIWGGSFFFARVAVLEIPPLNLVLFRVGIAAAALQLYLLAFGPSFRPAFAMAGSFFTMALLNNVIPFSLMFAGQTELGAGVASILNATTPFWTMLVANMLTEDDRLTPARLAGVGVGMAGTALMVLPGLAGNLGGPVWAKLAILGMAISYAFAFVYARRFRGLPPQVVAAGQLSASTVIMVPVVMVWHGPAGLFDASLPAWSAVLALALLSTAVGYFVYFRLIGSAGSTNASLVTLIVPVSGTLLGAIFLAERLEWFELAGMGLIGFGLVVIDGRLLAAATGRP